MFGRVLNTLLFFFFFSIGVFFHEHSRSTGQQGKGEGIYLTALYHFHPLHRHLDISRAITAESSPLRIAGSRTRTGTFGFRAQVANHQATRPNHQANHQVANNQATLFWHRPLPFFSTIDPDCIDFLPVVLNTRSLVRIKQWLYPKARF